jgi:hypothetical protein
MDPRLALIERIAVFWIEIPLNVAIPRLRGLISVPPRPALITDPLQFEALYAVRLIWEEESREEMFPNESSAVTTGWVEKLKL